MKNIVIIGMKNSGKSTLARILARYFDFHLLSTDDLIEKMYANTTNEILSCREIYKKLGKDYFFNLEKDVLKDLSIQQINNCIIDTGGSTPLDKKNQLLLKSLGVIVFVNLEKEINFQRIMQNGTPAFFPYPDNPRKAFEEIFNIRIPHYKEIADFTLNVSNDTPENIVQRVVKLNIL